MPVPSASAILRSRVIVLGVAVLARAEYGTALDPAVISPVIDGAVRYGIIDKHVPAADLLWKR
jgi:hypothetical protein